MTVTRQRLEVPPAEAAERHARRQDRDRVRVVGFYAGRTGQRLSVGQAAQATGLPLAVVHEHVTVLAEAGFLEPAGLAPSRFGMAETWRRLDLEQRQQQGDDSGG